MSLDGFVVRALVQELSQDLTSFKINKIYQPNNSDLILNLRGNGHNINLLLSANPTYPRIHITNRNYINPLEPPMFCMLLRKHLEGGIITTISQKDNERIIHIDIRVKNEIGDIHLKRLIVELMGRHSNIILLNEENIIIDGINHVSTAVSRYRQILPGRRYIEPPKQDKLNPFSLDKKSFTERINIKEEKLEKQLVDNFTGMSPTIAKEIVNRIKNFSIDGLWESYKSLISQIEKKDYQHTIVSDGEKEDFSVVPLTLISGQTKTYHSINDCIEEFYKKKTEKDTIKQKASDLIKFLNNEKQKNEKKLQKLLLDLQDADNAEQFKLYGELITANLFQINKGSLEIKVINYYSENQEDIIIPLDPLKSPNENAQFYFRKYNKLKKSKEFINLQLNNTKEENDYLDTILAQIDNASLKDIDEIREELIAEGYLKSRNKKMPKKKREPELLKILSTDNVMIYVGKNNIQNDYLTNKIASPTDTWLHTKGIPGSHVVIKEKAINEKTLHEAAMLAAYFSKAKNSSNVPVDYTLIKYVKKPNGAKPGFVTYDKHKTLYVTPDEEIINHLLYKTKK